jgi:mercuric ion binding protein
MKRVIPISAFILTTVVILGIGLGVPRATTAETAVAPRVVPAEQSVIFAVDRMTCAACPITVRKAMERVDGVRSVSVDFATRTATVLFDPSRTTPEEIGAASTRAGYPATPVS